MGSLSEIQKSILIGSLLGDGSLRKKTNTLFEVNHSYKQRDYVLWLYSKFREYVNYLPKLRVNGENRISCRFTTRSIPAFNEFYNDFYFPTGHKTISKLKKLDNLSRAIWFMDDGSKSRNSVYLNTQQFSYEDQLQLVLMLKESFNLRATLNKDKCYFRIRISSYSISHFRELVLPYLHPSMLYKLPL